MSLLNPISHSSTRAGMHRYKVEPFVVAADVYSMPPHVGRGGWTWYTGSAGWMYQAAIGTILGFQLRGERFEINPCIPKAWREYEISFRTGSTLYRIRVENPNGVCRGIASLEVDGIAQSASAINIVDDGQSHLVRVVLGEKPLLSDENEVAEQQTATG
jgi:cyclic beta-1,2-glucan synthetase